MIAEVLDHVADDRSDTGLPAAQRDHGDAGPVIGDRPGDDESGPFQRVAVDAVVRQHRDAHAFRDHHLAHLGTVDGVPLGRQIGTEEPVHEAMHDVAGPHGDELLLSELVRGHFDLPGEWMRGRDDGHRPASQQPDGFEFGRNVVAVEQVDQSDVERTFGQAGLDVVVLEVADLDGGGGVLELERAHRGQHQPCRSGVDRPDAQQPARRQLIPRGRAEPGHRLQHIGHRLEQFAPGEADLRSGSMPVKQGYAEFAFQIADRFAQGRLGDMQVLADATQ